MMEKLLLPRRKVLNDFPFNQLAAPYDITKKIFEVGSTLRFFKADNGEIREYWYHHPVTGINYKDTWLDQYPNIFKKLLWWQEREPEEMPRYVKLVWDNKIQFVHKVVNWIGNNTEEQPLYKYYNLVGTLMTACVLELDPATEEEYDTFINKKNKTNGKIINTQG